MTVPVQVPSVVHTGNGVTTVFPYPYLLLLASDLSVTIDGIPVSPIAYSVSGVGIAAGGSVTFVAAPAAAARIVMRRDVGLARATDYQYAGDFQAATVNKDFDRIWMALQDQSLNISTALRFQPDDTTNPLLPPVAGRALTMLGFDADGALALIPIVASDATGLALTLQSGPGSSMVGFRQAGAGAGTRTLQAKARERIGYGDHSTLAQSIDLAGGMRPIDMAGLTANEASTPVNTYGTRFINGKVLVPSRVPGYSDQLNTYAPDVNGLMVGRENLAAFWKACTAGTLMLCGMYGDSTVENSGAYPLKSNDLVQLALYAAGVNGIKTNNRGVSGTSWSDLSIANVTTDLAAGAPMKLMVIKYGINDAVKGSPLATMMTDARTKLTAIRALSGGAVGSLSIVLMGPNSTYRPSTGQDYKWYEDLRNAYIQLAAEFECAYFDTYAYLQNTRPAFAIWQDDIGALHESIHPDPVAVYWIWYEAFKTHILAGGYWNIQKSNAFFNLSNYTRAALISTTPAGYNYGLVVESALAANGWPADGHLVTVRHADGTAVQTLSTLDVVPRTFSRRGGGAVWTQWGGLPIAVFGGVGFLNSWANKAGGYQPAGYQVGSDGFVDIYGVVSGGTLSTACFQLPANARPANTQMFMTAGAAGAATPANVTVFSDGNVIIVAAANTTISLGGVRFKVLV